MNLPAQFIQTQREVFGQEGMAFVERLPQTLATACERWDLSLGAPFDLSFNYVAPATRSDGAKVVLKAGVAAARELNTEIEALQAWNGSGMVRLLECDRQAGVMLLERAFPGRPLADHLLPGSGIPGAGPQQDEAATRIAAGVMRRLWRPLNPPHAFPSVADWATGLTHLRRTFAGGCGPFPAALVDRAEGLFAELLPSQGPNVLLHGDLHHWNILTAEREPWLAIDPKGVAGEREYECGAFLRNPMPMVSNWRNLRRVLQRRVAVLSEMLGFDRQRVAGWALAQAVLSAWWSYEDSDPPRPGADALRVAEALI